MSLLQILGRIEQHKFASTFLKCSSDEGKIKLPMDLTHLTTIKKQIENGKIENVAQLERNLFLMLLNFVLLFQVENINEMSSVLAVDARQILQVRKKDTHS